MILGGDDLKEVDPFRDVILPVSVHLHGSFIGVGDIPVQGRLIDSGRNRVGKFPIAHLACPQEPPPPACVR